MNNQTIVSNAAHSSINPATKPKSDTGSSRGAKRGDNNSTKKKHRKALLVLNKMNAGKMGKRDAAVKIKHQAVIDKYNARMISRPKSETVEHGISIDDLPNQHPGRSKRR